MVESVPVVPETPVVEVQPVMNTPVSEVTPVVESVPVVPETPVVEVQPAAQAPSVPVAQSEPVVGPVPAVNNVPTSGAGVTPSGNGEAKKELPVGLFIGGAVGAVVLIIVIILLVLKPFGGGKTLGGPKGVVDKYINNLITLSYGNNYELVDIPENSFLDTNDYIEYVQKKSEYQGLAGFKIEEIIELNVDETSGMYSVVLMNEAGNTKNIGVNLKSNNGWKVEESNFYIKEWSLIVPKGTTVTIDGKEVSNSLIVEDATSANTVKYTIPAITSTKKEIILNNPLQSMTVEETPLLSNSGKKYEIILNNQELVDKAYAYVKDTWNQMYASYIAKENVSDVASKYFDSSVDINNVDVYYNQSFKQLVTSNEINHQLLEVVTREDGPNKVLSDELIQLNFGYKLSWLYDYTYSSDQLREMTRYSKMILKYDGSSFKIYDVQDTKLFSYSNYFTNEY